MKPSKIVIVIVALIGVFFLFKRNKTAVTTTSSGNHAESDKESVSLAAKGRNMQLTEKQRQAIHLESQLGMGRIALKRTGSGVVVPVTIAVEPVCHPGDFDAIEMEMKKASDKTLLVSIEPLDENSGAKGKVTRINYSDLKSARNMQLDFTVAADMPRQYGIFVCSDSQGADSCRKKPSVDINAVFSYHLLGEQSTDKPLPKDKIYYFQYAVIGQDHLAGFHQTPKNNFSYKKLAQYAQVSGVKSDNLPGEIKAVSSFNSTLDSYAPNLTNDQFSVRLPVYDESKCK